MASERETHGDHSRSRGVAASVVRLGVLELSSPNPEDFTITDFIEHESYNVYTKQNDIAVAKLNHDACDSAKFPLTIRPACLWQTEQVWQNKAIASGWGFTGYAGSTSNELMKVKLDILNSSLCDKVYGDEGFTVDRKQLCAGVLVGGQDTCNGGKVRQSRSRHSSRSNIFPQTPVVPFRLFFPAANACRTSSVSSPMEAFAARAVSLR